MTLAPNRKAKKYLGWKSTLPARVAITYTPTGGSPNSLTSSAKFKLVGKKHG